ncbi:MAG: tetratricopeptide repeat protein [Polyangiales bacterium]
MMPWNPQGAAAEVLGKLRAGQLREARDVLHAALPWAPQDPSLCHAGGELYLALGFAREAMKFYEVVERAGAPGLAADATEKLARLARDGTEGSKDVAVCVLTLAELHRAYFSAYARGWPYAHWESSTLADPCWVLNPSHLEGWITGGHAAPPGHPKAWWTIRYAIEALEANAINDSLGGRFVNGDVLVFLETDIAGMPVEPPTDQDRLATTTVRKVTALEYVTPSCPVTRLTRVYVAGRILDPTT